MLELANKNTVLHLIDYLKKNKLTDNGICGLLGNLYAESGVRLDNLQNSYEKKWNVAEEQYVKEVNDGTWKDPINGMAFAFDKAGFGLAQWTSSGRKQGLLNYAHELNLSIASESVQFGWLIHELSTSYKNVLAMLCDPNATIEDCAEVVVCKYEKPKSVLEEGEAKQNTINRRIGYAKEFYAEFFGKEVANKVVDKVANTVANTVANKNVVVAINAGHWLGNTKSIPKDAPIWGGTLEWTLNCRVVDKFVELAKQYDGITVVQNYDVTGQTTKNNELADRVRMAEEAKADIYLSIHHNAVAHTFGTTASGMTIFYYNGNATNKRQATAMYNEIKSRTGLKGNRATPIKGTRDYYEITKPTMNSYIIECAFMDSNDVYYISKDEWPTQIAEGIMAFLVSEFGFTKKSNSVISKTEETNEEVNNEVTTDTESKDTVSAISNKVKITEKTIIYSKTDSVAEPGVYTITEEVNGMGKLKSGKGWISLAKSTKV